MVTAAGAAEFIFDLLDFNAQRLNRFFYFFIQFFDGIRDHFFVAFLAAKQQWLNVLLESNAFESFEMEWRSQVDGSTYLVNVINGINDTSHYGC